MAEKSVFSKIGTLKVKNGTYKKMFTTKKLKLTNLSLKSGKTYYYKVKAIKTNKTAANSAFSIVKKVKCK